MKYLYVLLSLMIAPLIMLIFYGIRLLGLVRRLFGTNR